MLRFVFAKHSPPVLEQNRFFSSTIFVQAKRPAPPPRNIEKQNIARAELGISPQLLAEKKAKLKEKQFKYKKVNNKDHHHQFNVEEPPASNLQDHHNNSTAEDAPLPIILAPKRTDINQIMVGDAHCPGCGAKFQTKEENSEGFVDPKSISTFIKEEETFETVSKLIAKAKEFRADPNAKPEDEPIIEMEDLETYERVMYQQRSLRCKRCHTLQHYNDAVDTAKLVQASDFRNQLHKLKDLKHALIVKIVDLLNPEASFIPDFANLIGPKHPVILIGNKVDLLPKNAVYSRVTNWLRHLFRVHVASLDEMNLKSVMLVSSTSGINMKRLASRIEQYRDGANVYVVGTTNVGKSTFINKLIHIVNGTYSDLFTPPKHFKTMNVPLPSVNSPPPPPPQQEGGSPDEQTQNDEPVNMRPPVLTESLVPGTTLKPISFALKSKQKRGGYYPETAYLFDTPGVWNPFLPANILLPKEYVYVHPKRKINPRFVRMIPGKSLFLGGLARIDYVSNQGNPYEDWNLVVFTVFGSNMLPFHVTKTENAERFYNNHLGNLIYPPSNSTDHPELFGFEKKKDIVLSGSSRLKAIVDIAIGGVCWVAVTGVGNIRLQIHAPKSIQIFIRNLPLMPFETYKLPKNRIEVDAKQ